MSTKLTAQENQDLQAQGFALKLLSPGPQKATYYDRNGKAYPNLPVTPFARARYAAKGFLLTPPTETGG